MRRMAMRLYYTLFPIRYPLFSMSLKYFTVP